MKISRPDLAALGFGALIAVCMTVCTLLRVPAPAIFPDLALIALSAGVGIAVSPAAAVPAKPSPAAAPEPPAAAELPPAAAVKIPAPAPAVEGAAVASHAP